MPAKVWRLDAAQPLDPAAVYDGLSVRAINLRFPEGVPSGGEIEIARVRGDALGDILTIPLEPGEVDAVADALEVFIDAVLVRRGERARAEVVVPKLPKSKPADLPMGTL